MLIAGQVEKEMRLGNVTKGEKNSFTREKIVSWVSFHFAVLLFVV